MISTFYRVEIEIPDNVVGYLNDYDSNGAQRWDSLWLAGTFEHSGHVLKAGFFDEGNAAWEWADFENLEHAQSYERALLAALERIQGLMKEEA